MRVRSRSPSSRTACRTASTAIGGGRREAAKDGFTADNDPHRERDFGSFTHYGQELSWKTDYYNKACELGSKDPPTLAYRENISASRPCIIQQIWNKPNQLILLRFFVA
jgi:Protein of unknown function (DUF3768)